MITDSEDEWSSSFSDANNRSRQQLVIPHPMTTMPTKNGSPLTSYHSLPPSLTTSMKMITTTTRDSE